MANNVSIFFFSKAKEKTLSTDCDSLSANLVDKNILFWFIFLFYKKKSQD